jgi:NitT/TauT family transport system substrate-binding protein
MAHINIEFTLFSTFYSPLISVMSGGFLQAEGLEADWTVSPPDVSAVKALEEGRADVIQSAPSQAFTTPAKGETPTAIHFAQINEMDGFFITGRAPDPDFDWKRLEGSDIFLFGGSQPLALSRASPTRRLSAPRGTVARRRHRQPGSAHRVGGDRRPMLAASRESDQ